MSEKSVEIVGRVFFDEQGKVLRLTLFPRSSTNESIEAFETFESQVQNLGGMKIPSDNGQRHVFVLVPK